MSLFAWFKRMPALCLALSLPALLAVHPANAAMQVLETWGHVTFEERDAAGAVRTVAHQQWDLIPPLGVSVPAGENFSGAATLSVRQPDAAVVWSDLSMNTPAGPGRQSMMRSHGALVAVDTDAEPDALDAGFWTAVRGRLTGPRTPDSAVTVRMSGYLDMADWDFNDYLYPVDPMVFSTDFSTFTGGAPGLWQARWLDPEQTVFEVAMMNRLPADRYNGITGVVIHADLEVVAGGNAEVEFAAMPEGSALPRLGAFATGRSQAVIPEPGTLAHLAVGLAALPLRRRR